MIKMVPNAISILRMMLSLGMIFLFKPLGTAFWILYFICGFSDWADGWIARKYRASSRTGEVLDSLGDVMMILTAGYVILKSVIIPGWLWIYLFMIAFIRILSLMIGYIRYSTWTTIHTYANKAAGLAIFFGIPVYVNWGWNPVMIVLCVIAAVSAVEEMAILLLTDKLNRNTPGIWFVLWKK